MPDDLKAKLNEIDAIAAQALKETAVPHETFDPNSSMLGTSYDDFVPVKKETQEPTGELEVSKTEEIEDKAAEIPPTTTDELPTVQEAYNADNYITSETYFGSADNMTYSIPDPQEKQPKVSETETVAHNIPMPDFSKLDQTQEPSSQPESSASDLDALAEAAAAALDHTGTDAFGSTVQEEYDSKSYVTNETYFGSADNIPYTGAAAHEAQTGNDDVAEEFAAGISGVDPTVGGIIPPAPDELFTAPNEFNSAPPADDEYAVSTSPAQNTTEQTESPAFTFYNADEQ
jgi:hypothetical protein